MCPRNDRASAYAEMALLRGDPSDGLPGVKGIGEKTASSLMLEYGSVDALRAAVGDPKSGLAKGIRAKLTAASDYLDAALPVVRVATDAAVEMSRPDPLPVAPVDPGRLAALADELAIGASIGRLTKAMAAPRNGYGG